MVRYSSQLTILEPELSVYAPPTVAANGTIVYNDFARRRPYVWQNDRAQPLNGSVSEVIERYGSLDGSVGYPVLAPDGTKLAGVVAGDFGRHTFAYVAIDLTQRTSVVLHTFLPVPTDAVLPWGIAWSPDSRWLALKPPSWDPVENGVWLVSADGATKTYLGIWTDSPVWIDAGRIVFTATIDGETRLQLYDLTTDERFALDVPAGAQAVQYVSVGSRTEPTPATPLQQNLTTVISQITHALKNKDTSSITHLIASDGVAFVPKWPGHTWPDYPPGVVAQTLEKALDKSAPTCLGYYPQFGTLPERAMLVFDGLSLDWSAVDLPTVEADTIGFVLTRSAQDWQLTSILAIHPDLDVHKVYLDKLLPCSETYSR